MKSFDAAVAETDKGLASLRMIHETVRLVTDKRLELYDLTEKVADILRRHDIRDGELPLIARHRRVFAAGVAGTRLVRPGLAAEIRH